MAKTRKVMESRSPFFDEKFEIFCRDLQKDVLYLSVLDQQESEDEVIGMITIPLREIFTGTKSFKLRNAQHGTIKLSFDMPYISYFYFFLLFTLTNYYTSLKGKKYFKLNIII